MAGLRSGGLAAVIFANFGYLLAPLTCLLAPRWMVDSLRWCKYGLVIMPRGQSATNGLEVMKDRAEETREAKTTRTTTVRTCSAP